MALRSRVHELFVESRSSASSRSLMGMMRKAGTAIGRFKVSRLMEELGLICKQPGGHAYKQATVERIDIPNHLNRQFEADAPNQLWCGDITYGTPSQRSPPAWGWRCLSMFGMQYPGEVDVGVCPSFAARGSEPKRR
ncbi:IS3 family transposase [Mycetohabitans sp. B46]